MTNSYCEKIQSQMSDTFYRKDNITYSSGTNMFRPIIPG